METPEDVKPDFEKLYNKIIGLPGTHNVLPLHINSNGEYIRKDLVVMMFNELQSVRGKKWISSKDQLPDYNVSVLVFIPEEDNHVTTGMYDISEKWVLLDEYRVPKSQVTYWRPFDIDLPEDKSYEKCRDTTEEQETITYQMRELNLQVYKLTSQLSKAKELIGALVKLMEKQSMVTWMTPEYNNLKQFLNDNP